jgi:hypothetical protein
MKMATYLYPGLLLIALVLIFFAIKAYFTSNNLLKDGNKTVATVIDLIEVSGDDGSTYKPVFEYMDSGGKARTFESDVSSRPASYSIGEREQIVYSSNHDEHRVISFWGLYRNTIIMLSIASPMLIIGGGYLLYSGVDLSY